MIAMAYNNRMKGVENVKGVHMHICCRVKGGKRMNGNLVCRLHASQSDMGGQHALRTVEIGWEGNVATR